MYGYAERSECGWVWLRLKPRSGSEEQHSDVAAAEAAENAESLSGKSQDGPAAGRKGVDLPRLQAQPQRPAPMGIGSDPVEIGYTEE